MAAPAGAVRKDGSTIRRMFGSIAPRYDLLNHILSGGLDVLWRKAAVRALLRDLTPAPRPPMGGGLSVPPPRRGRQVPARGYRVLDLCAGTLDLACALSDTRRLHGRTVALDFTLPMLRRGRHKLGGRRARQILPVCADALRLPLGDGSFDAVMVGFGVRNFEDLAQGLAEARRVLAPGGVLIVLEFSQPENPVFRSVYELYNRSVLPAVGGAISGNLAAYRYLPASVAEFPDAPALAGRIEAAGFDRVRWRMLTGGIVALHEAWA